MDFKEYQDVFNMSIKDRRDYLKDKPDEYKKKYFQYDNKERSRLFRIKKNTKNTDDNSSNITHISQDPLLNNNPELFKQKIDDMFKNAQQNAIISNSNIDIVSEVINNQSIQQQVNNPPIQQKDIINNPPAPIQAPIQEPKPIIDFTDKEVFYKKVVYADLIVAKDFCYENEEYGGDNINPDTIKEIKNYNIKIPIKYLKDVFVKMPINNTSRVVCDTENMYIYFN